MTHDSGSNISMVSSSLRQDVESLATSNRWVDFYIERRVVPLLRTAVDSGHLPTFNLDADVERLVATAVGLRPRTTTDAAPRRRLKTRTISSLPTAAL